jgi:hypothetical protein
MSEPAKPIDPDYDPVLAAFDRAAAEAPRWIETDEERAVVEAAKAEVRAGARPISHAEVMAEIERRRFEE